MINILATLDRLLGDGQVGTFDFAFTDADKDNYSDYYDRCFKLVRQGRLILIDNVLWGGKVADLAIDDDQSTLAIKPWTKISDRARVRVQQ